MKSFLQGSTALAACLLAGHTHAGPSAFRVYFGTSAQGEECGIYMAMLDMNTGSLSDTVRVSKALRPAFIVIHPDGRHLYATEASSTYEGHAQGVVSAFRILDDGMLADINTQPSGGTGPCHLSFDPSGTNLLVANYRGGSCSVLPIRTDGALTPPSSIQTHAGSSIHPERQNKAHAHSMNTSPDGCFAFVADLGMDKIMAYRFNASDGLLKPNNPPFTSTEPGSGPRHFTFHPSGKFAYACMELSSTVTVYSYDAENGALREIQTLTTLPEGYSLENSTAEVITSSDGHFLYVSNRGHNSVAIFRIDTQTGLLTSIDQESVQGEMPRHFNIDPTGTYLLAANLKSCTATVFRIDRDSGRLAFTGHKIEIPSPTCIQFFPAPPQH